jgi:hypothetical protein
MARDFDQGTLLGVGQIEQGVGARGCRARVLSAGSSAIELETEDAANARQR